MTALKLGRTSDTPSDSSLFVYAPVTCMLKLELDYLRAGIVAITFNPFNKAVVFTLTQYMQVAFEVQRQEFLQSVWGESLCAIVKQYTNSVHCSE